MPDNIGYTPGIGASIAADEIGGNLFQRIKPTFGDDGTAVDVSITNPMPATITQGELVECLEALRMSLQSLNKTIGSSYPDTAGRLRVAIDSITGALTLATITTVGTVTTVTTCSTLTNQSQIGGISANNQVPALMTMTADNLRRNITVS